MTNQQRPVLTGPNWSFDTKIILNYSPIYELFNGSKNIIFGAELKELQPTQAMWLIITPITCVTIQLETATSSLLVPTTTLNLKSPPLLYRAHGEYSLWVKLGKSTPTSLPQPQPPLHHPPTQHEPAVSPGHLFAPPLVEGCGHSQPLPHHLQHCGPQQQQRNGRIDERQAYRQGCRRIDSRMGVLMVGHACQRQGMRIDGGACVSMAGLSTMQREVTKQMDIIEWWQVCKFEYIIYLLHIL